MPPRSKVAALPPEIKTWLDRSLVDNQFGQYEALADELAARGYAISKSALHRYGSGFEERLSRLKLATEQARAVVEAAPDDEGKINEALIRLVQNQMFELLADGEGQVDLNKAAKAIADLGRASVTQKKWAAEVRQQVAAEAAERAESAARRQGISNAGVAALRAAIMEGLE